MTSEANKLNLFDFTMIVVSLVIGMGIFRTPINVAKASPELWVFFAAWIFGGIIAWCGALTYAEIGSRMPVTGGYYKIFSYAYHPSIAFAINCVILVSNAASLAAVALVGSEYLTGMFIPLSHDLFGVNADGIQAIRIILAIAAILIFYGINLLGLRLTAKTQNVLTLIKISLILVLITPLFFDVNAATIPVIEASSANANWLDTLKAFGVGLVAVSFTYGGYQQTINFGAEVKHSAKNIPLGIFLGISIIITLYMAINLAYINVIGFDTLKDSTNIAAIMASKLFGVSAQQILSGLLFLSVLAYVNVLLLSNPRVMSAMCEDKILPTMFSYRHPKTDALSVSLTVFAGLSILILFWAKEFDTLLSFTIFLDCFGMILSAATIFTLRKKTRHLDNTGIYQMKLFPLLPLIFIAAYCFVGLSIVFDYQQNDYAAAVGSCVMILFIGLYFFITAFKKDRIA